MPISPRVKNKEKEIIKDLERLGSRVSFRIDKVDPKTRAWEHTIGFFEVLSKEEIDEVWEVVSKHYGDWIKEQEK